MSFDITIAVHSLAALSVYPANKLQILLNIVALRSWYSLS